MTNAQAATWNKLREMNEHLECIVHEMKYGDILLEFGGRVHGVGRWHLEGIVRINPEGKVTAHDSK